MGQLMTFSSRLCNPPPWLAALNLASLEIFEEAGMEALLKKQFSLTGYLEYLLLSRFDIFFEYD